MDVTPIVNLAVELDRMRKNLGNLPPKFQAVLALDYLEDLGVAEIAMVLDCRAGTVKSRLARARDTLRAELLKESPNAHQKFGCNSSLMMTSSG